jgi:hypothetical protein
MNIFVGNLSFDATEEDVKKLFEGFGQVVSAVIVKEKNGKKSRGFGFVEMVEQSQGEAAVNALNLKEFMGRPLNVSPERPKTELDEIPSKNKKLPEKIEAATQEYHGQKDFGKDKWFSPVFRSANGDKKRRSRRSFGGSEGKEVEERPKVWRKNADESKPAKRFGEHPKSWRKPEGAAKPWRKNADESKPAKRFGEHPKPWRKSGGEVKPWRRPEGAAKPWSRSEGEARPWRKPEGAARPWRKSEGGAKPWQKSSGSVDSARKSRQRPKAFKR